MTASDRILRDTVQKQDWDEIFQFANENNLEVCDDNTYIYFQIPHVDTADEKRAKEIKAEIATLQSWLTAHDYIGIKIATGRATSDEYATEIAEMKAKADRINELEAELASLETSTN